MLALFIGGPIDGKLLQLPDDTQQWTIAQLPRLPWYSDAERDGTRPIQLDEHTYRRDPRLRSTLQYGYADAFLHCP